MDDDQQNLLGSLPPRYELRPRIRWKPRGRRSPGPVPWPFLFSGIFLPLICFIISFPKQPAWQSGNIDAYAALLLAHKQSVPLYPFLLYNMISLGLLFGHPDRFSHNVSVRFGIYSGVLMATQYWILFQISLPGIDFPIHILFSLLAVLIPWGLWHLWRVCLNRFEWQACAFVSGILCFGGLFVLPYIIFICLWCSTPWALGTYLAVALRLGREQPKSHFRFGLARMFAVTSWLAAHFAAWRVSYLLMLDDYAKLPTGPPSCFVCSAAAGGHPRFVGSTSFQSPDGTLSRVNDQLRRLKAIELMLLSISPGAHRRCRRIYDWLGPRAASRLNTPLRADVAYVLLKPLEWLAHLCLVVVIPGQAHRVCRLYAQRRS